MARQSTSSVSVPPSRTPMAAPAPPTAPQTPSAFVRSLPSRKVPIRMDAAQVTRKGGDERGGREEAEAREENAAAAQQVGGAAAEQQQAAEDDGVARDDPSEVTAFDAN